MSIDRWIIEAVAALVLLGGGWAWWVHHDHVQQQIGADRVIKASAEAVDAQKVVDEAKLASAEKEHADESRNLADGYAAALAGIKPRVVYVHTSTGSVPAPAPAQDQGGPAGDGPESCTVSVDLQYAVLVLARRLDDLNAEARAVNEALGLKEASH